MTQSARGAVIVLFFALFAAVTIGKGSSDEPRLGDWPAPATWTPPRALGIRSLGIKSDIGPPLPFIPVSPCRQYDSRNSMPLPDGATRTILLAGPPCGINSTALAFSVNITVFNITGATGNGVFKVGPNLPLTTAWINYSPAETQRGNAGIVPTNGFAQVIVQVNQGGGQVDLTVDVNGYYSTTPTNQSNYFSLFNNSDQYTMLLINNSATCTGACGLLAGIASQNGGYGVQGNAVSASGLNYGVLGTSLSTSQNSAGIRGEGNGYGQTIGVEGVCNGGYPTSLCDGVVGRGKRAGGYFASDGTDGYGVQGLAVSTSGVGVGVFGSESSTAVDSAGVKGVDASGSPGATSFIPAGVRGESARGFGVLGVSQLSGVMGVLLNSSGDVIGEGLLGYTVSGQPNWGVFASQGQIGCLGCTKSFVDPHPTDAAKSIHYVSLEGPEAGTYFRGTSRTVQGQAVIEVPDHFRWVTQEEGMTVQLTPVGELAMMAVASQDLHRIVVLSSKDVAFHYFVQGVRPAWKDFLPVKNESDYMPQNPKAKMPKAWTEWTKQRLVANGTFNADGTVNMETAERAGWTKIWADREARAQEAQKTRGKN